MRKVGAAEWQHGLGRAAPCLSQPAVPLAPPTSTRRHCRSARAPRQKRNERREARARGASPPHCRQAPQLQMQTRHRAGAGRAPPAPPGQTLLVRLHRGCRHPPLWAGGWWPAEVERVRRPAPGVGGAPATVQLPRQRQGGHRRAGGGWTGRAAPAAGAGALAAPVDLFEAGRQRRFSVLPWRDGAAALRGRGTANGKIEPPPQVTHRPPAAGPVRRRAAPGQRLAARGG